MKLIGEMTVAEIGDEFVAVPIGEAADKFRGIVRLNKTGKEIWDGIAEGLDEEQIADRLLESYDIDRETALKSIADVAGKLEKEGILVYN